MAGYQDARPIAEARPNANCRCGQTTASASVPPGARVQFNIIMKPNLEAAVIAFGCIAISATLAGLYGFIFANTVLYGGIRAASLCAVAIAG